MIVVCLVVIAWSSSIASSFTFNTKSTRDCQYPFKRTVPSTTAEFKNIKYSTASSSIRRSTSVIATTSDSLIHDDDDDEGDAEIIRQSFLSLPSGSDIRGQFVADTSDVAAAITNDMKVMMRNAAKSIKARPKGALSGALTPFAAYCMGYSFAKYLVSTFDNSHIPIIAIGRDPRPHGTILVESFSRGAADFGATVKDTGIATTPSMFEFCRAGKCDGGVMVTASHLPIDKNGFKFFSKAGGFSKSCIRDLMTDAANVVNQISQDEMVNRIGQGVIEKVDFMPHYAATLRESIIREIKIGLVDTDANKNNETNSDFQLPLAGLRIVLNSGHGSGGFFYHVLHDLGADVFQSQSLNIADASFPRGIPNPESDIMVEFTTDMCQEISADIGIMLDTDADRCGFIVPASCSTDGSIPSTTSFFCADYQPLNRNRLIALLGVIFSERSPGCTFVTDSVTSEGLATFLTNLGLVHVRYLKGYANVINKAIELTQSGRFNAEVAIETSGHCAMKENGYLDDGTYTAVKVIACLAKVARERNRILSNRISKNNNEEAKDNDSSGSNSQSTGSLLDMISSLEELDEVKELRITVNDGSLDTTEFTFQEIYTAIEDACLKDHHGWELDRENLEGIRARTGNGGFFMMRKSLHDPILSLQVEGQDRDQVRTQVIAPIVQLITSCTESDLLDLGALQSY